MGYEIIWKASLFIKIEKVIFSCENKQHIDVTETYIELAKNIFQLNQ